MSIAGRSSRRRCLIGWPTDAHTYPCTPGEPAIRFLTRVVVAIYLIEAGLLLIVAPWTTWWQRNYFAELLPWLRALMSTPGMHVTVVLVGLVTVAVGISDLWMTLVGRYARPRSASDVVDS